MGWPLVSGSQARRTSGDDYKDKTCMTSMIKLTWFIFNRVFVNIDDVGANNEVGKEY